MTDYYISPTGNDTTGDGSRGNPLLTIAKFIAESVAGDTCICHVSRVLYTIKREVTSLLRDFATLLPVTRADLNRASPARQPVLTCTIVRCTLHK